MPAPAPRAGDRPAPPAPPFDRLVRAAAGCDAPFAVVDLEAFDLNARDLVDRAGGLPVRVASKSVRCRALLRRVLARPGFAGILAYNLREALWLAGAPAPALPAAPGPVSDDVVVAYPSADRGALAVLAGDEAAARAVTIMVDDVEQLDLLDAVVPPARRPAVRVCLDLDASLRPAGARLHLGVRRSPLHDAQAVAALARAVVDRPGFRLVGLLSYEAQVAGLGDAAPVPAARRLAVRAVKRRSVEEVARRRAEAVAALRSLADLEFVNGGGTGSLETTAADPAVTEVAAGSGLYGPTLFDTYRTFRPRPAAFFALPVVRRPAAGVITVAGGGWVASGPPGRDRLPRPVHPPGLRLLAGEGAGEVQTPLAGGVADRLAVGDLVWFRHAKAGELCEHVDVLHLAPPRVEGSVGLQEKPVATYRGEGAAFG